MNQSLRAGYWRFNSISPIVECPYPDACIGGKGFDSDLCAAGYEGYLCSLPQLSSEYIDALSQDVESCDQDNVAVPIIFSIIGIITLGYQLVRLIRYSSAMEEGEKPRSLAVDPLTSLLRSKLLLCYLQVLRHCLCICQCALLIRLVVYHLDLQQYSDGFASFIPFAQLHLAAHFGLYVSF
jgi:hypothetical protein